MERTKSKREPAAANVTPITPSVERVQTFKTPDGKFFTTEAEAMRHVLAEQFKPRIDAYLASRDDWPKGTAGRIRSVVGEFLAWEESQK
ncbi:hypothetical protein [Thiorhodovibrio frisius]|uniref:Uncharacterized protein n=1 Tax=Thiorhodovibrio frisius TaxID=631362 RepID=H8Z1B1_9GAMM|nr:hypothetical protein [Thiorhodovibrio frisius]EIC21426.1 hypothetical protein Thi970DRAFT_01634 [Thiorhodovibrio frisius]WPL24012.1 hypothetical protein Thiofri_04223 [Thiorhodovibrio frisius]